MLLMYNHNGSNVPVGTMTGKDTDKGFMVDAKFDLSKDEDVPLMLEALEKRGYTEAEVDLLLGGNFLRLFKSVWD